MNIKCEYDGKVGNISIINHCTFVSKIADKDVIEVLSKIEDIKDIICKFYGIIRMTLMLDKLEDKIKMEIIVECHDKKFNEFKLEMSFESNIVRIDLDSYTEHEELIKEIKKEYKNIVNLLKQKEYGKRNA